MSNKKTLTDLQGILFSCIDEIEHAGTSNELTDRCVKKAMAINELAETIVQTAGLQLKVLQYSDNSTGKVHQVPSVLEDKTNG